jgi:hypothetical protein
MSLVFTDAVRQRRIFKLLEQRKTLSVASARKEFFLQTHPDEREATVELLQDDLDKVKQFTSVKFKSILYKAECKNFVQLPPLVVYYGGKDEVVPLTLSDTGGAVAENDLIPDLFLHFHGNTRLITVTICQSKTVKDWSKYEIVLNSMYRVTANRLLKTPDEFFVLLRKAQRAYLRERLLKMKIK